MAYQNENYQPFSLKKKKKLAHSVAYQNENYLPFSL